MGRAMTYKRYPKYKDSGVEWIGAIPGHWDTVKIARLGRLTKANGGSKEDNADSGIPCIRYGELYTTYEHAIRKSRTYIRADRLSEYTPIHHGDVLFAASGETFEDIGRSAVTLLNEVACCGGDVIILKPESDLDPLFLGYALDSIASKAQKALMGKGYTVVHIYADQLRELVVALPPQIEQNAISSALDRETARIDALIEKKTHFVELLKEKRQALITHAVTKGLDPDVKMKDSGVEWIGEVPEHWAASRLAHFAAVENGTTPSRANEAYWTGGDIAWLGSGEVNQVVVTEATEYITALALRECSLRVLPNGTVVVGMVGQGKTRGLAAILGIDATINQNLAAVCAGPRLNSQFLLHTLTAAYEWLREGGRGSNQAALNCELLGEFRLAVPPQFEQLQIIAYIAEMTERIDSIISKTERSRSLLKERRAALISAAVTGQIDLREHAA